MSGVEVAIKPLSGKYYQTEIDVFVNGHDFGRITICMYGDYEASEREVAEGYTKDEGMNHVESSASFNVAKAILSSVKTALEKTL